MKSCAKECMSENHPAFKTRYKAKLFRNKSNRIASHSVGNVSTCPMTMKTAAEIIIMRYERAVDKRLCPKFNFRGYLPRWRCMKLGEWA